MRRAGRILRSKLGKRVPLTDSERGILVKYGLRIKNPPKDAVLLFEIHDRLCLLHREP